MDNNVNNNLNNDVMQNNLEPVTPVPGTMKFDPMTGEPIVHEEPVTPAVPVGPVGPTGPAIEQIPSEPVVEINTEVPVQDTNVTNNVNDAVQIQNELQSIPTVEQGKEAFINNVQAMHEEKKEEKKEGVSFVFIIILFVVILAAIFFLFPLLLDYI